MNPGNAKIIKCPFCGTKKEVMTLLSGNTFGARIWSDAKRIAPMLPEVSIVQKCPKCGKYYLNVGQPDEYGEDISFELGTLSYQEWKEAYFQFMNDKEYKVFAEHLKLELIQAYNDCFREDSISVPAPGDDDFIAGIIKEYIDSKDWNEITPLLKAELYREAGEMENCSKVLSEIDQETLQDFETKIFEAIKEKMEQGDRRVFELSFLY